jgi:DNA-binding GntR family transcriptional regulator
MGSPRSGALFRYWRGEMKPYYELVRDALARNVANGNLPPGTRLLAASVADRLNVSRPPVKRALELLVADGVITARSSHGYVVGQGAAADETARLNLHQLDLDLPLELGEALGRASWERIYAAAEADVLNCVPFGTFQVSEAMLGEHFEVSRTVVREVLARLDAQGLIAKDRASHWLAGPLGARMLDEAHELRLLLEPRALVDVVPNLEPSLVEAQRGRLEDTLSRGTRLTLRAVEAAETDLHVELLTGLRNRRLAKAVTQSQISLVIGRLFGKYIGVHDETELLREHRLVYDHLLLRDAEGAAAALRHHLEADHGRSRARLKVLSVFDAPDVAPYLTRIH